MRTTIDVLKHELHTADQFARSNAGDTDEEYWVEKANAYRAAIQAVYRAEAMAEHDVTPQKDLDTYYERMLKEIRNRERLGVGGDVDILVAMIDWLRAQPEKPRHAASTKEYQDRFQLLWKQAVCPHTRTGYQAHGRYCDDCDLWWNHDKTDARKHAVNALLEFDRRDLDPGDVCYCRKNPCVCLQRKPECESTGKESAAGSDSATHVHESLNTTTGLPVSGVDTAGQNK